MAGYGFKENYPIIGELYCDNVKNSTRYEAALRKLAENNN